MISDDANLLPARLEQIRYSFHKSAQMLPNPSRQVEPFRMAALVKVARLSPAAAIGLPSLSASKYLKARFVKQLAEAVHRQG